MQAENSVALASRSTVTNHVHGTQRMLAMDWLMTVEPGLVGQTGQEPGQ
jgi:hypothetical protein